MWALKQQYHEIAFFLPLPINWNEDMFLYNWTQYVHLGFA